VDEATDDAVEQQVAAGEAAAKRWSFAAELDVIRTRSRTTVTIEGDSVPFAAERATRRTYCLVHSGGPFILLPLVALSWVRVVKLSESGSRGRMLAVLTLATIVGGWLATNWATARFGSGGIHD
jgi:hypothetical protein